jgi:hypothetical protein
MLKVWRGWRKKGDGRSTHRHYKAVLGLITRRRSRPTGTIVWLATSNLIKVLIVTSASIWDVEGEWAPRETLAV